jgi:hypothetical protein
MLSLREVQKTLIRSKIRPFQFLIHDFSSNRAVSGQLTRSAGADRREQERASSLDLS